MAEDLKPLMIERGTVKAALTRFKTFICKFATTTSVGSLKKRLEANVCLLDNFNRIQTRIEILVAGTDAEAAHAIEREEFETAYFDLIDQVEIVIARATPEQSRITTNSPISAQTADTAINIRLPTLQLPSFDGNYSDWVKFKDTFTSVIHENNSLTDIQRFHYLNTSLKGVAARVIQALGVSGTNYRHAWELLKSRYEDSTSLKRHHVNSLLDLKSIQRESDITLREFLDEATNHRIALMSLGESVETWDTMLVPLLSRKLGQVSMREWDKRIISQSEMPTFGQFSAFIEERSKYLANIAVSVQIAAPRVDQRPRGTNNNPRYNYIASHVVNSAGCPACKANHAIYNCDKFKNSDLNTKTKIVQEARLCFNCLSSGHRVRACTRSHCKQCGRKHHSLLHNPEFKRAEEGYADTGESDSREPPVLTANVANTIGHAVLSTAIVYVKDKGGQSHKCRVLLDSGSQANFITTAFCQRLGIKPTAISSTVTGLGRAVNSIEGRATLTIHSRYNKSQHTVQCLSIETITSDMPNFQIHREKIEIPSHIELADPEFHLQRPIDMIIGAGLFWTLLCVGQHKSTSNLLLQKTQLGWVLGGTPTWADKKLPQNNMCCLATLNDLQSQLERFWDIEELTPNNRNQCSENTFGITCAKGGIFDRDQISTNATSTSKFQCATVPKCTSGQWRTTQGGRKTIQRTHRLRPKDSSIQNSCQNMRRDQRLTFEELYTLLTQIESCLNSRPLSPLSSDPTDLNPLTPGHFLIGTALTTLPSHDLRDIKVTRLNRYQLIQQMVQHFWQRWQRECIQQLQQRHKWQHSTTSKLAVDSLVIIKEDSLPPLQWSMGRIVQSTEHSQKKNRTVSEQSQNSLRSKQNILTTQNTLRRTEQTESTDRQNSLRAIDRQLQTEQNRTH
ncbi:uncharacterized protein LOC143263580, partial [Megalopta genalis]|uniref:uncharacterized protein LOC143263580 n=1 Tax=Megalopta genalis TaxID=115081 RepID=UPI003FD4DB86